MLGPSNQRVEGQFTELEKRVLDGRNCPEFQLNNLGRCSGEHTIGYRSLKHKSEKQTGVLGLEAIHERVLEGA